MHGEETAYRLVEQLLVLPKLPTTFLYPVERGLYSGNPQGSCVYRKICRHRDDVQLAYVDATDDAP
jgi:hypothetical protein